MNARHLGFTLVEAMTVLSIIAIGLTVAVPAFSSAMTSTRTGSTLNQLSTDMAMARSSAIMSKARIAICASDRSLRCRENSDWSQGWLVFKDPDGNRQPDNPGDVLRVAGPPSAAVLYLPATRELLRFRPDGRAYGTNLTVNVCQDDIWLGSVIVSNIGRVRSTRAPGDAPCPLQ